MAYSQKQIDEITTKIFTEISEGLSARKAILNAKISSSTFWDWLGKDEAKANQYARACEERADAVFESIEDDYSITPERDVETGRIDTGWVQLQRLKIDAKKWSLGKMNPKKYGDKVDLTSNGKTIQSTPLVLQDGRSFDDLKKDLEPE